MPDTTLVRLFMPTKILPNEISTHLTALFWVELWIRQHKAAIHYQRLPGGVICALEQSHTTGLAISCVAPKRRKGIEGSASGFTSLSSMPFIGVAIAPARLRSPKSYA